MPIYEYRCTKCGDFEQTQRISDPPLARCPKCRRKVQRLISATSFQLKGSGWYVTDYARSKGKDDKKKDATATESKNEAKSEAKSEGSSEAKPESKPEKKAANTDTSGSSSS